MDLMNERQFEKRYPCVREIHDRLLELLSAEGIGATWTVVGAMSLAESRGALDERMQGLPEHWTARIPAGDERTHPLWYARSFVRQLQRARTPQEIGMHGGISHLIWGDRGTSSTAAERELRAGMQALLEIGIRPRSFVFPRDLEALLAVLGECGIRCYRGRSPILSERFGYSKIGGIVRAAEELARLTPMVVWPEESKPGLWNLRPSMFIYSLGAERCRIVPARLRVDRTRIGLKAAIRRQGIFHLALHPENLAESLFAFSVFESMIHEICRFRDRHGLETLTMIQGVDRVAPCRQADERKADGRNVAGRSASVQKAMLSA
jgi:hypothetical protein